jgi:hypothetical protein
VASTSRTWRSMASSAPVPACVMRSMRQSVTAVPSAQQDLPAYSESYPG